MFFFLIFLLIKLTTKLQSWSAKVNLTCFVLFKRSDFFKSVYSGSKFIILLFYLMKSLFFSTKHTVRISCPNHTWFRWGTCGKWWSRISVDRQNSYTSSIKWSSPNCFLEAIRTGERSTAPAVSSSIMLKIFNLSGSAQNWFKSHRSGCERSNWLHTMLWSRRRRWCCGAWYRHSRHPCKNSRNSLAANGWQCFAWRVSVTPFHL